MQVVLFYLRSHYVIHVSLFRQKSRGSQWGEWTVTTRVHVQITYSSLCVHFTTTSLRFKTMRVWWQRNMAMWVSVLPHVFCMNACVSALSWQVVSCRAESRRLLFCTDDKAHSKLHKRATSENTGVTLINTFVERVLYLHWTVYSSATTMHWNHKRQNNRPIWGKWKLCLRLTLLMSLMLLDIFCHWPILQTDAICPKSYHLTCNNPG